jgi:cyclic-di-GMP-binding protein
MQMALSLKLPLLEDKPLIIAEMRPQKIAQFISGLPQSKPMETASLLLDEMEILNRQKIGPEARIKALEAYRPAVINLTDVLAKEYCAAPLPLPALAKSHADAGMSLWQELGYGYKLALVDLENKLFGLGNSKLVAHTIRRAIESLSQLAMVYYQIYFTPPGTLWGDLHQLYLYAVQQSLHEMEVAIDGTSSSINLVYTQALLMSLADPQHLSPNDIKLAADYIARFAHHTQLQGIAPLENPAGIFLISLNTDKPPIPYVKNIKETDGGNDILLITMDLARLLHQHIQMLQSGNIARNSGLPDIANDARYQDILVYLIKHWGASPKRIYNRSRKSDGVELGIGLATAHYFINGEASYTSPTQMSDTTQITAYVSGISATGQKKFNSSRWQALNMSAGGMALRRFPNAEGNVRVGELLSVKNSGESNWSLGVLRWVSINEQQQLDIGTQLIAPEAKAAGARVPDKKKFEPVLLLPELPAIKQPGSVVSACGLYGPARVLELEEQGKISRIMLTKLIERTGSFERFQFSYL